jgi:hypothetical protein
VCTYTNGEDKGGRNKGLEQDVAGLTRQSQLITTLSSPGLFRAEMQFKFGTDWSGLVSGKHDGPESTQSLKLFSIADAGTSAEFRRRVHPAMPSPRKFAENPGPMTRELWQRVL